MNNPATIVITAIVVVIVVIAIVVVIYAAGGTAAQDTAPPEPGSLLHPQVQQEARTGYVIAELYQDVHLDVDSWVYDPSGVLRGNHWTHDAARQTCSVDLVLAVQEGRDQVPPTATPRPPDPTGAPGPAVVLSAIFNPDPTPSLPDRTIVVMPTPTPNGWSGPTPYPTATPSPLISSVSWIGWKGRPVAIEADGVAVVDVPRDADVSANLSVWTGPHQTGQTRLDRLPLPEPEWNGGAAQIRLQEASGRILLDSDHIDVHHRSTRLRIEAGPLSDCGPLNLRWEKPAAIVLKALTAQPYADWQDHRLPPTPVPTIASLSGLTLTGMTLDPAFDTDERAYTAAVSYRTATTTVRPLLAGPGETYVISLGGVRQSDNTPAVVQLTAGDNVITVVVTSADSNTSETYTVTVSRETPSTDATLSELVLGGTSPDEWEPDFAPDVFDYDVYVPYSTVRTAVLPRTSDPAATFTVATEPAEALTDSGYGTALVELPEGATTTVTIMVTAEDSVTVQPYVVRIHRAAP